MKLIIVMQDIPITIFIRLDIARTTQAIISVLEKHIATSSKENVNLMEQTLYISLINSYKITFTSYKEVRT